MKLVGSLGAERWTTPLPIRICLDVISFQCANFEVLEADLIIYRGSYMSACFVEFIKRVGEKR